MLAMAGCSHMPVTSMVKLARVDFETSDPAQLRAAIKLPRTLAAPAEWRRVADRGAGRTRAGGSARLHAARIA